MFSNLDYQRWFYKNNINELFNISLNNETEITQKTKKDIYELVDPENKVAYPPELDDLIRLHFLVRSRKVTTILEFGVGKSTVVFADAIKKNQEEYGEFVNNNLRRVNPFQIHAVDNSAEWINQCKKDFSPGLANYAHFYFSEVEMTTFNGRICTAYKELPNICPDFIYLDAPGQYNVIGDVRGISTESPDRLPMSADILLFEPFLLPGTLIVVDGRSANARFLKNNFQRNWEYHYFFDEDIHTFELVEAPLGKLNEKQLRFCFPDSMHKFI